MNRGFRRFRSRSWSTQSRDCFRLLVLVILLVGRASGSAGASPTIPLGFEMTAVLSGLLEPTATRFAPDGRVFVAEKAGRILSFDSLDDPSPTVVVDIRNSVNSSHDRGLLGLAVHPGFPNPPFVYALFTYDAPPGQIAPVWNDVCPSPPSANVDGCVVSGRLSRFELSSETTASEVVLIGDAWCQQFSSHSIGALAFGPDGALYVSAGDGANFSTVNGAFGGADFGQLGGSLPNTPTPVNPCGDPPGGNPTPPLAEGGALRAQDILTLGDPVGFSGSILRLDPITGTALPDNPLFGGDPDDDAVVAFGFRNPFRFAVHPTSGELFVGDVGWNRWEELDRFAPTSLPVENFGWPCYEGPERQPVYEAAGLALCELLYSAPEPTVTDPFFAYAHQAVPVPGSCGGGQPAAITGVAALGEAPYPAPWPHSILIADIYAGCIWALLPNEEGAVQPDGLALLVSDAGSPVDLTTGPNGKLYVTDLVTGVVRELEYTGLLFRDGFESGDTTAW
ncbi:MAG: PQQ-dependent sugar dehydrogenase [Thermoanaerobaculia bacterium]|nr:PQQ-dependent sugar dehydrogenase [Thermoanaerobaculia bacterium]